MAPPTGSELSNAASAAEAATTPSSSGKRKKRVRKLRERPTELATDPAAAIGSSGMGANVTKTLTSSPLYLILLLVRFLLIFVTPASLEGIEYQEGVDVLASALLPGVNSAGLDPAVLVSPPRMRDVNATRSIVGAFITSGIPYMATNVLCSKVLPACPSEWMGVVALYVPRVWMFFLSLIGDVLLVRIFAVYEGEHALSALLTYASTWTTLIGMTRNTNFALEALCVVGIVAGCFGWEPNVARPLFWLNATALALGVFLRPIFFLFIFTPIIYLSSLWGKPGIDPLRYVRASLEGLAIFGFWCSIWVAVDSVFIGTFKLRFGETVMENFDMFVEYATKGLPFSYKGSLVYTPVNAAKLVMNKKFFSSLAMNTSPGQMFLSLPAILGPLFIVLIQVSYEGMKVAMKELMADLKQAANGKKAKKRKPKKAGMTKEREEELLVFFDTIQTTVLLGLLIEVLQNHDRLGTISLMALMPPCIVCIAGNVFGPASSKRFRMLHIIYTVVMVLFFGLLHQGGITRVLLKAGAGGIDDIPQNADLVMYQGIIGHRSALGANVKNISVHDGGDEVSKLMETLRDLKNRGDYREDRLLVCAPATVELKEEDFMLKSTLAYGHMSMHTLPNNIDDALTKSALKMYRFVGDEDEAMIKLREEEEEEEERLREERAKEKSRKKGSSGKDDL